MLGQRLKTGMRLKLAGQAYSIEQRLPNGDLQLKHTASETLITKPESELVSALFEGDAELLGKNGEVDYLQTRLLQLRIPVIVGSDSGIIVGRHSG